MHNLRTVGKFEKAYSDLKLYFTCRQTFYSLKETTANINQQIKAKSNYQNNVRKLSGLSKQLIQQDGLDFIAANELTELLSTEFRSQIDAKYKNAFHRHQSHFRGEILFNLELKALDQGKTNRSLREMAGFECLLRTLTGCVYSPVVKSKLEQIRDTPYSQQFAVAAISEFLNLMFSGLDMRNTKRN